MLSFCISTYNNLEYLKIAIDSVRKNSYYKDAPESPDAFTDESRYYTFNYEYQPNEGITNF